VSAPEPADLGRFEPTPYDLGITDDPEVTWADVQPAGNEVLHHLFVPMAEPEPLPEPEPEAEL
jgi:hypothetical protein